MQSSTTPGTDPKVVKVATPNGMPGQQTNESGADEARRQAMQRAEELADRLGEQIGQCVSAVGHSVLKWVARAREEAEDIWAEAHAIRLRRQAANDQSENTPPGNG
jgi:hypothetical protein